MHTIRLCVFVRREFDHLRWFTRWKITDELRKNYGMITHKSQTNHALQRMGTLLEIYTPIKQFQWFSVTRRCYKRETCVLCLLIVSGKSSMNARTTTFSQRSLIFHAYSCIVRLGTTQITQNIRKTAQYSVISYAKSSFELLKTWKRIKRRSGEHLQTTTEVPSQKNWWNVQIVDVSRKTRILCAIHAFTRILGSVTAPLHVNVEEPWVRTARIETSLKGPAKH